MELVAATSSLKPYEFPEICRTSRRPIGGALKSYKCFCCGGCLGLSNHHITSRTEGGSDSLRNKVTLCSECHDAVEGLMWADILARRDSIREERYAAKYPRQETADWVGQSPLEKIASIRRYCLTKGVFQNSDGKSSDFRQAFRTLNSLYGEVKAHSGVSTAPRNDAEEPRVRQEYTPALDPRRAKIDRLRLEGTPEEWAAAIVEFANAPDDRPWSNSADTTRKTPAEFIALMNQAGLLYADGLFHPVRVTSKTTQRDPQGWEELHKAEAVRGTITINGEPIPCASCFDDSR